MQKFVKVDLEVLSSNPDGPGSATLFNILIWSGHILIWMLLQIWNALLPGSWPVVVLIDPEPRDKLNTFICISVLSFSSDPSFSKILRFSILFLRLQELLSGLDMGNFELACVS